MGNYNIVICGSRTCKEAVTVVEAAMANVAVPDGSKPRVVSGGARGADRAGEMWAKAHGYSIQRMPANWVRYGKLAGRVRNREMALVADAVVALWDGESKGTKNMIEVATQMGLPVFIHFIDGSDK